MKKLLTVALTWLALTLPVIAATHHHHAAPIKGNINPPGGAVLQGAGGSAGAPWYMAPGTGATWTLGGTLPAFASTPTFNLGTSAVLGTVNDAANCAAGNTSMACWRQIDSDIKAGLATSINTIGIVNQGNGGSAGVVATAATPWFVTPGTGATWTLGGTLPAFASTPTVNLSTQATITSFQYTCTASAVQMAAHALVNGVTVKSLSTNNVANFVYVGPSGVTTGTGFALAPGESVPYALTNTNGIYIICSVGDTTDKVMFTGN